MSKARKMSKINSKTGKIKSGKLTRGNPTDAGQDIHSSEDILIGPRDSALIDTNLRIQVPLNHVGMIKSRSGLSVHNKLEVGAGIIDHSYQGEVKVHLYNHGENPYMIKKGDRIAQLITMPINTHNYDKVEDFEQSERGESGFGSTGK